METKKLLTDLAEIYKIMGGTKIGQEPEHYGEEERPTTK